jgi:hypothetical protein
VLVDKERKFYYDKLRRIEEVRDPNKMRKRDLLYGLF